MKKIVFCVNQIVMGGTEKILCQLLTELIKDKKYKIYIVSKRKVVDNYFLNFFHKNNIKLINDSFLSRFIPKYENIILKKADVIIDFCNFTFYEDIKNIYKNKKIAWCHGSIVFFNNNNLISKIHCYDKLVCLSSNFLYDFCNQYPEYKDKIVNIYNPFDITNIESLAQNQKQDTPKEKYFVHVSRLDGLDKDVKTVIKAFNIFSKKDIKTKLYIVGDGQDLNELKDIAKENKNIIFTGRIDEPYKIIKNSIGLILSSNPNIGEGLPCVLIEAQILKTIVISSNVPSGPSEILLNGDAGFLFEPGNYNQLADIMLTNIKNPDKYKYLTEKAYNNLYRFDIRNIIPKIKNLIDD